jgi:hypothetical protein
MNIIYGYLLDAARVFLNLLDAARFFTSYQMQLGFFFRSLLLLL